MEFQRLILLLCIWTVYGYPSRPLNDRPSELAWQAWLLVDSQNHPTEGDRRITPKSVFIAPKLGQKNDSLPDCAEGYQADAMGRCIKFVKVDQAEHLKFLLQRLNAVYATKPNEDEPSPTPGPLQVNIPLGSDFSSGEEPDPNPQIAIIVAPTNGNFDVEDDDGKINVKRTNFNLENNTRDVDKLEESQFFLGDRGDNHNVQNEEEVGAYDGEEDGPDDDETNGAKDGVNTEVIDEEYDEGAQEESSTKFEGGTITEKLDETFDEDNTESTRRRTEQNNIKIKEVTTGANEQDDDSTEEPISTTDTSNQKPSTSDNLQALFFLVPINNASHVQNNRTTNATALSGAPITQDAPVPPTKRPLTNSTGNSTPLTSDTEPSAVPVKAKPDTETQVLEDLATLIEPVYPSEHHLSDDLRNRQHLVRFPDHNPIRFIDHATERIQSDHLINRPVRNRPSSLEKHSLTNEEIEELFKDFIQEVRNSENGSPYRKRPIPKFPYLNENPQIQRPIYDGSFNHRNRDRNSDFWKIPPEPREQNIQKPLVLRFEKHPVSNFPSRYNTELYYPHESSRYYEETTRENIPNIFTRRSRRNHFR